MPGFETRVIEKLSCGSAQSCVLVAGVMREFR